MLWDKFITVVLQHAGIKNVWSCAVFATIKVGKVVSFIGHGNFYRSVATKIKKYDPVTVADDASWLAITFNDKLR